MSKVTQTFELVGDVHTAHIIAQEECLVSWQGDPLGIVKGASKVRLRGSGTLSIDNPSKKVVKVSLNTKQDFAGEKLDDLPPPDIAPPSNWLQAMRQRIRNEMGTTREAFAERMSIYEVGDVDLFEEELEQQNAQGTQDVEPEGTSHSAEILDQNNDPTSDPHNPVETPAKTD